MAQLWKLACCCCCSCDATSLQLCLHGSRSFIASIPCRRFPCPPHLYAAGAEVPKPIEPSKVIRSILADKPRVTRFNIEDWS